MYIIIYMYACVYIIYIYIYKMSKITFFLEQLFWQKQVKMCRQNPSVPLSVQSMADSIFLFHDMDV